LETLEKPQMPILQESPDHIYQRIANRAIAYARENGQSPPATEEGEIFYDFWYPLAKEISEQQQLSQYSLLQAFVVWSDGEFLDAHGYAEGVDRKEGEETEAYRQRILHKKRTEEGSGRAEDYIRWALEVEGVGGAVAIEHERHDVSIDLYLTDLQGQPVTLEFASLLQNQLEPKRIAGHDLKCFPAEILNLNVRVKLQLADVSKRSEITSLITNRIQEYIKGSTCIVYHLLGALFWVDGVKDYSNYTLNDGTENLSKPIKAVPFVNLVVEL